MSARGADWPPRHLAAVADTARARLRHGGRNAALVILLAAGLGAWAGTIAGAPAFASGEIGGSQGETGTSPTGTGTSGCPSSNPPNQMELVAGTPQTAILGTAFATGLQVALSNSNGCPVTSAAGGVPVTFSAPSSGASGVFSTSNSNAVIVGADASGSVAAPTFTANATAGSYTLTASSQYGSVSFSLTNAAAGVWCPTLDRRVSMSAGEPVNLTAGVGSTQSTTAGTPFPIRLAVTVTDAEKNPVPDAQVTFSAPTRGASGSFSGRSSIGHSQASRHDRYQVSHRYTVKIKANACGIAVAPAFTANHLPGGYIVKASVKHAKPAAFALVNEALGQSS
ncbi:MAG TPA: hypothetical protein VHY18_01450 [Solirubrobacteraceae bacterium]|jgi:hypothetical protein|nr:hypothetical protein [Solirubrobacteraceae bacterium]